MTQVNGIKANNAQQPSELKKAQQEIAQQDGKDLFFALLGNTNKEDQKNIAEIIEKTDAKDIGYLLKGYSDYYNKKPSPSEMALLGAGAGAVAGVPYGLIGAGIGALGGFTVGGISTAASTPDKIFEQMDNEYFFSEKKELMMDLTKKCHEYLKNDPKPDTETQVNILRLEEIINKGKIRGSHINKLDDIADKIVNKLNEAEKAE